MYARCLTAIVLALTQIFPTRIEATKHYRSNAACWNGGDGEPSCRDYCLQVPHLTTFTCRERITTGRLPIRGGNGTASASDYRFIPTADTKQFISQRGKWKWKRSTSEDERYRTLLRINECIEFDFSPHRSQ